MKKNCNLVLCVGFNWNPSLTNREKKVDNIEPHRKLQQPLPIYDNFL